jgi:glycosyltransferase involved in cell wall biosynthesis
MRLAVFHDFLDTIGGGEKVALTLAQRFDADLWTTNVRRDVLARLGAEDVRVRDLGPLVATPPLKQIHASWRFRRARAPGYDVYVFSGNWTHYAGARHGPGVLYCHTPVRAFYDQRRAMLASLPPWQRPVFRTWTRLHARLDRRSVGRLRRLLANSENVRRRIRRFYGREAIVVHPPVATRRFRFRELGDFWLSANRLYPEKRIHLQFDIFRRLPEERLLVAGGWARGDHSARYVAGLRPPPNVRLLGEVSEDALADLYSRCRGLLATAVDEDFGLTPVEAMAAGKVVLATDEGGYRETVRDGETGWLLPAEAGAFVAKIRALDDATLRAMRPACEGRARAFDEDRFVARMGRILEVVASDGRP